MKARRMGFPPPCESSPALLAAFHFGPVHMDSAPFVFVDFYRVFRFQVHPRIQQRGALAGFS